MSLRAAVRPSAPHEGWVRAGNVLLVVLVTALQVTGRGLAARGVRRICWLGWLAKLWGWLPR